MVTRHALKNAFIPVMTILGLQLGRLLGGTVVLENIYALPGWAGSRSRQSPSATS